MAKSYDLEVINAGYKMFESESPKHYEYLKKIPGEHWLVYHCDLPRFNVVTSNTAECLNAALREVRQSSPLQLIQRLMTRQNTEHEKRLNDLTTAAVNNSLLSHFNSITETSRIKANGALSHTIDSSDRCLWAVTDLGRQHPERVKILADSSGFHASCSCGAYRESGLPCHHIFYVATQCRETVVSFPAWATTGSLRQFYALRSITPTANDVALYLTEHERGSRGPPPQKIKQGRKKVKRFLSNGERGPRNGNGHRQRAKKSSGSSNNNNSSSSNNDNNNENNDDNKNNSSRELVPDERTDAKSVIISGE